MKRLADPEWLIVQPALSRLADLIRGEIETAAAVDAMLQRATLPRNTIDAPTPAQTTPPWTSVNVQFREAVDVLRRYGLSTEADEVLRLYGDSCENAEQTLKYVEAILVALRPETVGVPVKPKSADQKQKPLSSRDKTICRMFADGKKPDDVNGRFPEVSVGNARQIKCRNKEFIAEMRAQRALSETDRLTQESLRMNANRDMV